MPSQPTLRDLPFSLEYDADEDVLHVLLEGNGDQASFITWVSLSDNPDVFLRVNEWDRRCLGISLKPASPSPRHEHARP